MTDDENQNDESAFRQKTGNNNLNRVVTILFVLGIYFLIFLKMLFLE